VVVSGSGAWQCNAGPILSLTSAVKFDEGGSGHNYWNRESRHSSF
jgi:hypothetical protein